MAKFVQDTFTDTNGTLLQNHTGEIGATWAKYPGFTDDSEIQSNRLKAVSDQANTRYYASGIPSIADVVAQVDVITANDPGGVDSDFAGLLLRADPNVAAGSDQYYVTFANMTTILAGNVWTMSKLVGGSYTELGTYISGLSATTTYVLNLKCVGTAISSWIDGVERISVTDSDITAAGRAGLMLYDKDLIQLDNFNADDFSLPPDNAARDFPLAQLWAEEELV